MTVTRKVWNNGEGVAHADLNGNFAEMAPLVARVGAQGMLNTMLGVPQEDISPLVAISSDSAPAIIGAIRSSDNPYVNQSFTIGTFAFNDAVDAMQQPLWSGYTEARRFTGGGSTLSYEHNIINLADVVASTPYNVAPTGFTTSLWLSSGRNDVPGCVKTSLALGVANNGTPFMAGIVFGADSLDGTIGAAGDAGYGTAMSMARHHQLVWTQPATGRSGCGDHLERDDSDRRWNDPVHRCGPDHYAASVVRPGAARAGRAGRDHQGGHPYRCRHPAGVRRCVQKQQLGRGAPGLQ
jgi:hypothetical protein